MQAEFSNNRGPGFIISPDPVKKVSPQKSKVHSVKPFPLKKPIYGFVSNCGLYFKSSAKKISLKIISSVIATGCTIALFNIFTLGTGVYINGTKVGTVNSNSDFRTALSSAINEASAYGVDIRRENIETTPVIVTKKTILPSGNLKSRILLSNNSFTEGCEVYLGDTLLFSSANEKEAVRIIDKYIDSYDMEGDARLSASLTYKPCVILKNNISTEYECMQFLAANKDVNVVSVVNSTLTEAIPFETKTENDDSLYIGESVTITEGQEGNLQISQETLYENGTETSSRVTSKKIVVQPIARVVKIGTKQKNVLETGVSYPLSGTLSSPFGQRWGRMHEGIDIAVPEGTPVKAAEGGTVSYVSENAGGYGKLVRIDHGYGIITVYAHLSKIEVTKGQVIPAGTVIALSGNTGRSTGPHLHFEITKDGTPIDPLEHLK